MIAKPDVMQWLEHRAGAHRLDQHPLPYMKAALELNVGSDAFAAAYGRREIRGYVGFVDLVGFSDAVEGKRPEQVASFLRPFLSAVIREAVGAGALVDKTIGDEVMFVLPDGEEDGGVPGVLAASHLLAGLCDAQRQLGAAYSFRLGLSYGHQFIDRVEGDGYAEWTVVGESVNLAKRLCSSSLVQVSNGIGGAFGVLAREVEEKRFRSILQVIAGDASRMDHRAFEETIELKGVTPARYAILSRKVLSNVELTIDDD